CPACFRIRPQFLPNRLSITPALYLGSNPPSPPLSSIHSAMSESTSTSSFPFIPSIVRKVSSKLSPRSVPARLALPPTPPGSVEGRSMSGSSVPALDLNDALPALIVPGHHSPILSTYLPTPQPSAPSSVKGISPSISLCPSVEGLLVPSMATATPIPSPPQAGHPHQVQFRIADETLLGEGQLAKVYRATVTPAGADHATSPFPATCVVKLIEASHVTPGSPWYAGLSEARILHQLQQDPAAPADLPIVRLLGVTVLDLADPTDAPLTFDLDADQTADLLDSAEESKADAMVPAQPGRHLAIILEYCGNGSLWSWVQKHKSEVGFPLWVKWAHQFTQALQTLHNAGFVHYDLKPHNVLLTDHLDIRLADLGSAWKPSAEDHNTPASAATPGTPNNNQAARAAPFSQLGTVMYTAPELLNPAPPRPISASDTPSPPRRRAPLPAPHIVRSGQPKIMASDIFSAGILLFITGITGQDPYVWAKSTMELMLTAMKGAFWDMEMQRARLNGPPTRTRSLNRRPESSLNHLGSLTAGRIAAVGGRAPLAGSLASGASTHRVSSPAVELSQVEPPHHDSVPLLQRLDLRSVRNTHGCSAPTSPISPDRYNPSTTGTGRVPPITPPRHGAGPRPFENPSLFFLNGDPVPTPVVDLLQAMVAKDPTQRPAISDVLRELKTIEAEYLPSYLY
ncbi:hypothetical protein H4R33_004613, partial [Dimargaris cristalligena]